LALEQQPDGKEPQDSPTPPLVEKLLARAAEIDTPADAGETPADPAAETETEALAPKIHPAARRTDTPEVPGEGVDPEYFIGTWSGKPLHGCPYCPWTTLEGSGAVELHVLSKIDSGDLPHRAALERM
jgi:hypothetical protein